MSALRRIPTVLGLAVLLLLAGGVAFAAIPSRGGTFIGCVNDRSGVLRVIDPARGQKCIQRPTALRETRISWNQTGPAGPVGPAGPAGPGGTASTGTGGLESLDQLIGLPCDVKSTEPGIVEMHFFDSGPVTIICRKSTTPTFPLTTSTTSPTTTETTSTTTTRPDTLSTGTVTTTTPTTTRQPNPIAPSE